MFSKTCLPNETDNLKRRVTFDLWPKYMCLVRSYDTFYYAEMLQFYETRQGHNCCLSTVCFDWIWLHFHLWSCPLTFWSLLLTFVNWRSSFFCVCLRKGLSVFLRDSFSVLVYDIDFCWYAAVDLWAWKASFYLRYSAWLCGWLIEQLSCVLLYRGAVCCNW